MKNIKVSLFTYSNFDHPKYPYANPSPMGVKLAEMLKKRWLHHQVGDCRIKLEVLYDRNYEDIAFAAFTDDVVIFDASLDTWDSKPHRFATQYRAVEEWMLIMEHFLIVSREKLPINFIPYSNAGGYPISFGSSFNRERYGNYSLQNEDLIEWIEKKINELSSQLPLPRKGKQNISKAYFKSPFFDFGSRLYELTQKSLRQYIGNKKQKGRAFVSYLSKYSDKAKHRQPIHGLHVEDLVDYIPKYHSDSNYTVYYLPPGEIADEFMDEFRRWQVLSMLENAIRAADEFWIFETDDYYDSWWTQAELAILAYISSKPEHRLLGKCKPPKVKICRPSKSCKLETRDAGLDFIPKLDSKTKHELSWRLEASTKYDYTKPDIGRILTTRFKGISEVDLDNFFNSQILTCRKCVERNIDKSHFNLSDLIAHEQKGQYRVRLQNIGTSHEPEICKICDCPVCGTPYKLNVDSRQYRWWPPNNDGSPTGPEDVYVEMRLRWKLKEHKEPSKQEIEEAAAYHFTPENNSSTSGYGVESSVKRPSPLNLGWTMSCLMLWATALDSKDKAIAFVPIILYLSFFVIPFSRMQPEGTKPSQPPVRTEPSQPPVRTEPSQLPVRTEPSQPLEEYPVEMFSDSSCQGATQASINSIDADLAFNLVKDLVRAWPIIYDSHDKKYEDILETLEKTVCSNSPYYNHIINGKNGVNYLTQTNSSYLYEKLKVEFIDYKINGQNPEITVIISGEYIFSFQSVPQAQTSFKEKVTYLLGLEDDMWKIYSSVSKNGSNLEN